MMPPSRQSTNRFTWERITNPIGLMDPSLRWLIALVWSFILGVAIWWIAPALFGVEEAWDVIWYYLPALFFAGILGAAVFPSRVGLVSLGILLGQVAYVMVFIPASAGWPLGMSIGLVLLLFAVAGAMVTRAIWRKLVRSNPDTGRSP